MTTLKLWAVQFLNARPLYEPLERSLFTASQRSVRIASRRPGNPGHIGPCSMQRLTRN